MRVLFTRSEQLAFCSAIWVGAKEKETGWLSRSLCAIITGFSCLCAGDAVLCPTCCVGSSRPQSLRFLGANARRSHFVDRRRRPFVAISFWYCLCMSQNRWPAAPPFRDAVAPDLAFQPVSHGSSPTGPTTGKPRDRFLSRQPVDPALRSCRNWPGPCGAARQKTILSFVVVASDSRRRQRRTAFGHLPTAARYVHFAYDLGGKAHAAFGFTGVPALVVLDRTGRVRLNA